MRDFNFDIQHGKYDRVLCWWSAGVTSAVATKLALEVFKKSIIPVEILYCDTGSEHPDNVRFKKDCERWYGQPIKVLKNKKYKDIYDVFRKERWLVGPAGARCTTELKKLVRNEYERPTDLQVFGYDNDEYKRIERFTKNNFDTRLYLPLIQGNLSKSDCLKILKHAGIEIPVMYKMGYRSNNCVGCVKCGIGYWLKIQKDFPEEFEKMSQVEQELGASVLQSKGKKLFLKDLDPTKHKGRYQELDNSCGFSC